MCFIIFPFDGGRIVHSIIWFFTENKRKSLKISHKISEYTLYSLVGLAFLSLKVKIPYFGGGAGAFINVMFVVIIGYLMMNAAKNGKMPHM